jgi:hypothetical protein
MCLEPNDLPEVEKWLSVLVYWIETRKSNPARHFRLVDLSRVVKIFGCIEATKFSVAKYLQKIVVRFVGTQNRKLQNWVPAHENLPQISANCKNVSAIWAESLCTQVCKSSIVTSFANCIITQKPTSTLINTHFTSSHNFT